MLKLIRNSLQCKKCGDIISSYSEHDFIFCSCQAIAVDGGLEYGRILGNREDYLNLSIFENLDSVIGTVNEEKKFVALETITLSTEKLKALFLDFLSKYNAVDDFLGSLDFTELELNIQKNSSIENYQLLIPVEKLIKLFAEFTEYYQLKEIFNELRNKIILAGVS